MCSVLLPPGVSLIAVKYIISYHIISYHIISYHIITNKTETSVLIIPTSVTTLIGEDNFDNGRSSLQACLTLKDRTDKLLET
jgi:hypothetical protein